ncbi:IS3 family transposase [Weissella fermenti]|uniref:IS3 family transposase n=1 Tax=Weissella fermenti TaxID=2987699 RepID=A0ABT6D1P6_9LACO|nr:IS3 family transposase [Weissella sp. BK2]MDF9299384.1 IS3 family transposase [Weissella sp. BK2]
MVTRYEEDFKKSIVEMVKAGRRPDELSKEYGPSADSIRNWVKKYAPVEVNGSVVLPIIHKNLVQGHRITRVLSALKIPMSTYSDWIHWEPSAQEIQHNKLRIAVESIYTANKGIYGYRRIAKTMRDLFKLAISDRFVWQLMSEAGLKSRMQKRYNKPTTVNDKDQMPNLIINLDDLSGVITTDITYIQLTDKTWVYMASAYDPEDRKVLSYRIRRYDDSSTSNLSNR